MSNMVKRETTRYYELPLKERDSITYEGALPKEKKVNLSPGKPIPPTQIYRKQRGRETCKITSWGSSPDFRKLNWKNDSVTSTNKFQRKKEKENMEEPTNEKRQNNQLLYVKVT